MIANDAYLSRKIKYNDYQSFKMPRAENIAALARILGHSSIKTTRKYAKTLRNMIKDEMKKLK